MQTNLRNITLDRTNFTPQGQVQLSDKDLDEDDDDDVTYLHDEPQSRSSTHHIVNSIKQKKHDAGIKIRRTLQISKASDNSSSPLPPVLADSTGASSNSRLDNASMTPEKHTLKDFARNPLDTLRSKAHNEGNQQIAANIAAKEISHGQDVDLVHASTAIDRATTEDEKVLAESDLSKLLKTRQSTYVRWTLDRHVTKIRVLSRDSIVKRPRTDFVTEDPEHNTTVDWRAYGQHLIQYYAQQYGGQYIGYGTSPPTPSKETIMPNVERLVVATSPLQEFIMTTRRVYRWEVPVETSKYLAIYIALWYLDLLLPGLISLLVYLVVERRIHGVTVEDIREDLKRTEDTHRTALSLTEFIEKNGYENWADSILQDLGPWLMIQLADLANFFESLRNFYEWRKPHQTAMVLGVAGLSIIVTIFIPTWLLVKSMTLAMGFTFFGLFPIAVNFPEYRLLVSPAKRLLWNIPTHAEWAIKYIQAEGSRVEAMAIPAPSSLPIRTNLKSAEVKDYGFYVAHHDDSTGHIVVSTDSVRFVSKHPHTVHFDLPYARIKGIEKQNRTVKKNVPEKLIRDSGQDLKLIDDLGEELVLKDVSQRDEMFSQIVGFSGSTWQIIW